MGRHRTARAREKLIRNTFRKLNPKRNRDKRLKGRREAFVKKRAAERRNTQKYLYGDGPDVSVKKGDLQRVQKKINQNFLQRVQRVQSSYAKFFDAVDNADGVIEVLDARDPYSFRYVDMEQHAIQEEKPLLLVINKIDLVPEKSISKWIASLSEVAQTIAVTGLEPK